jgi:hypothetical protein
MMPRLGFEKRKTSIQDVCGVCGVAQGKAGVLILNFMNSDAGNGKHVLLGDVLILRVKGDIGEIIGGPRVFSQENIVTMP